METGVVQSRNLPLIENEPVEIIRLNITMPKRLKDFGTKRAAEMCIPSFSAYLHDLIRRDCGLAATNSR